MNPKDTMAEEFTMPKLGLTMTDGTIREWLVPDGTPVNAGDPVLMIETDKVETEVEARIAGVLQITGALGENYECGEVIGFLLADGEAPRAAGAAPAAAPVAVTTTEAAAPVVASASAAAAPVAVASDVAARGEGGRVLASPRARAAARDSSVSLEAVAGTGPNGRIVADDVAAFAASPAGVSPGAVGVASAAAIIDVATRGEGDRILASPRARAAARAAGVDLIGIAGTGPNGRIVADDVDGRVAQLAEQAKAAAAAPAIASVAPAVAAAVAAAPTAPMASMAASGAAATAGGRMLAELLGIDLALVPTASPGARITREDVAAWVRTQLHAGNESASQPSGASQPEAGLLPLLQEPTNVIPLKGMRGIIAERMHASLSEMAQLTLSIDADMTAVSAERDRRKAAGEAAPGYTAWVVSAAAKALTDHPYVNSQITADGVAYLPDVHVGVAVALDDGLIVPVVDHANVRTVAETHARVADLASRARNSKLTLNELEGATFSVTALGMYGVDGFTPVINPPNTAILGVGRLRSATAWVEGQPTQTTMMTLSLTWDHRAFDGAPAAQFAQSIVKYLENPGDIE